jgi:hypothetical protein
MNYNGKINNLKLTLESDIENEYKLRIKELNLIDTGETLRSIKCSIVFTSDGFNIEITSTPHYKYLDNKYGITTYVINLNKIDEGITNLYAEIILNNIL